MRLGKISGEIGKLGGFSHVSEDTGRGKVVVCNEWLGCKGVIKFYAYESIHFNSEIEVSRFKKIFFFL